MLDALGTRNALFAAVAPEEGSRVAVIICFDIRDSDEPAKALPSKILEHCHHHGRPLARLASRAATLATYSGSPFSSALACVAAAAALRTTSAAFASACDARVSATSRAASIASILLSSSARSLDQPSYLDAIVVCDRASASLWFSSSRSAVVRSRARTHDCSPRPDFLFR